ncbi:MAG: hypothetical protein CL610_14545 [Anaerolineaceae bacterium]|nr:hypothetical protein [Anaerolineaceae bacterium]
MPARDQLIAELQGENEVGILLMGQMGGVPNELQLFIQTAQYDETAQGLRDRNNYLIRVLSVREHRLSLGLFGNLFIAEQHPILLHHNEPQIDVLFEGTPADVNELVLDVHQAYASTFGPWRELAADINREQPLVDLLKSGSGRLGTMPKTAAERMGRVLEHHGLTSRLEGSTTRETTDEHGRSTLWKLLGIGDSYFVALDFAVDRVGKQ